MKNIITFRVLLAIATCIITFAISPFAHANNTEPASNLLVEGKVSVLNVHSQSPRLSWYANVDSQGAYQVQVATSAGLLQRGKPDLWDSKQVSTRQSVNISYSGKALETNQEVYWRVRVWAEGQTNANPWSEISKWQMGLVNASDWTAKWLQAPTMVTAKATPAVMDWMLFAANIHKDSIHPDSDGQLKPSKRETQERVLEQLNEQETASLFRHSFSLPKGKQLVSARLHSTAAGYYEIFINGFKVDDRLMDPGQTDYDKRILYNTDNVDDKLLDGENTIAVHLGSGWYNENIAFSKWSNPDATESNRTTRSLAYGRPAFIAQLEVKFADGSTQIITSNENWLTHPSPVLKEGLFSGELFDANQQIANWNQNIARQNLTAWEQVQVMEAWPTQRLEPQLLEPIKAIKALYPIKIYAPEENVWVLDFGQNFTGIPTVNLHTLGLEKGQGIHMRYAEWIDKRGNISQKSGGGAPLLKQVDTYISNGKEQNQSTWTPTFTWHGFRYMEIRGLTQAPSLDAIYAHLVRSSVEVVGEFESSDPLVNRIHDMALWGYESNLMAVPMDCPIRERAGWTGDAHAALITGNYNYNMDNFWNKYLGDFETASFVAPAVVPGKRTHGGNYDWAAAEIMIAWEHYRHHGDIQLLSRQFESMQEYLHSGESKLDNNLLRIGYGDWCDPVKTPGIPRVNGRCSPQQTTPTLTSSALFAHTANLMSKISKLLDKAEEHKRYTALFESVKAQFNSELFDQANATYGSQTGNAMALMFDIAPKNKRTSIAASINQDVIEEWGGHASTGALGQTYLYRALSDYGFAQTAFNIFTASGYPGYRYLFEELNATTLWERKGFYDPKQDPDGTKAPGFSLNHPFHTGYDGWFYEGLGGIRPSDDSVAYQDFELKPHFVEGLNEVKVSYKTGYGKISSHWKREGDKVIWQFTVPNNTKAKVSLPNQKDIVYKPGTYSLVYSAN